MNTVPPTCYTCNKKATNRGNVLKHKWFCDTCYIDLDSQGMETELDAEDDGYENYDGMPDFFKRGNL